MLYSSSMYFVSTIATGGVLSDISNLYIDLYGCRRAREDEAAATRRLNEMVANYGDVIPRRDYEGLQKIHEVSFPLLYNYACTAH